MRLGLVLVLLAACAAPARTGTATGAGTGTGGGTPTPADTPTPTPTPTDAATPTPTPAAPDDSTDGTHPCDRAQLAVTDSHYVWLGDGREEVVSIDEAVARLAACADVLAKPKICEPAPGYCRYRETPIWWTVAEGDERVNERRWARVEPLWKRVQAAGLAIPEPNYTLEQPDDRVPVYRSRKELGASAALVPRDFDFRTRAIARAFFPGGSWERHCLDEALGMSPAEYRASQRAEAARERRLRHGKAARFAEAALRYRNGTLVIETPDPGEPPPTDGRCRMAPVLIPVLVPIPRTLVTVVQ